MDSIDTYQIGKLREILLLNELGGDRELIYKFSDPDGVRTGKSGWSFALCQFDIANNGNAALCLRECGFTAHEIAALRQQTIAITPCNARLHQHAGIVDDWDNRQLHDCLKRVRVAAEAGHFDFENAAAMLAAADYHNQFYLSKGGKFFTWATSVGRPLSAYDIYRFKLTLPWGLKRPDDVTRRHANIIACAQGGTA